MSPREQFVQPKLLSPAAREGQGSPFLPVCVSSFCSSVFIFVSLSVSSYRFACWVDWFACLSFACRSFLSSQYVFLFASLLSLFLLSLFLLGVDTVDPRLANNTCLTNSKRKDVHVRSRMISKILALWSRSLLSAVRHERKKKIELCHWARSSENLADFTFHSQVVNKVSDTTPAAHATARTWHAMLLPGAF